MDHRGYAAPVVSHPPRLAGAGIVVEEPVVDPIDDQLALEAELDAAMVGAGAAAGTTRVFKAGDFRTSWTNLPPSYREKGKEECHHKRHMLDLQFVALGANVLGWDDRTAAAAKRVFNDARINKHPYDSTPQNVGDPKGERKRIVSDLSAAKKLWNNFTKGERVALTSHEVTHFNDMLRVLEHPDVREALGDEALKLKCVLVEVVAEGLTSKESGKYTEGELDDRRRLGSYSAEKRRAVRELAEKYKERVQAAAASKAAANTAAAATIAATTRAASKTSAAAAGAISPSVPAAAAATGGAAVVRRISGVSAVDKLTSSLAAIDADAKAKKEAVCGDLADFEASMAAGGDPGELVAAFMKLLIKAESAVSAQADALEKLAVATKADVGRATLPSPSTSSVHSTQTTTKVAHSPATTRTTYMSHPSPFGDVSWQPTHTYAGTSTASAYDPSNATALGITSARGHDLYMGPRGGIFHISPSGTRVYHH